MSLPSAWLNKLDNTYTHTHTAGPMGRCLFKIYTQSWIVHSILGRALSVVHSLVNWLLKSIRSAVFDSALEQAFQVSAAGQLQQSWKRRNLSQRPDQSQWSTSSSPRHRKLKPLTPDHVQYKVGRSSCRGKGGGSETVLWCMRQTLPCLLLVQLQHMLLYSEVSSE